MVSLDDGRRETRGAERSDFNDDPNEMNEEEELFGIRAESIHATLTRQVHTVWIFAVLLVFLIVLEALAFLVPLLCSKQHCYFGDVSSLLVIQILYWSLMLLANEYCRREHLRMRYHGYLMFYRKTRLLQHLPLVIFSFGNIILLALLVFIIESCSQVNSCLITKHIHSVNIVQALISLEVLVCAPFTIVYIIRIEQFNKQRLPPDIHHEDVNVSYSQLAVPDAEIGFRSEDNVNDVVEKQGDYIRYLKQHNENLGRRVMSLAEELRSLKSA